MARSCALGLAIIFSAMLVSAVGIIGYRPVCAADGEDAGRAPPGAPMMLAPLLWRAAAVADRSGDARGDAGVA